MSRALSGYHCTNLLVITCCCENDYNAGSGIQSHMGAIVGKNSYNIAQSHNKPEKLHAWTFFSHTVFAMGFEKNVIDTDCVSLK